MKNEFSQVWQAGAGMARTLSSGDFKKILSRRSDMPKQSVLNMELIS